MIKIETGNNASLGQPIPSSSTTLSTNFRNSTTPQSITTFHSTSPVQATDDASARCDAAIRNQESAIDAFLNSVSSAEAMGISTVITQTLSYTETQYSSILYTLEDGYPRLRGIFPTKTSIHILTYTATENVADSTFFEDPMPDCISTISECGNCTIYGASVQLNYWPTPSVLHNSNRTITSTSTRFVVAVVNGTTFTSPSVYLSYGSVYASNACRPVGNTYPGAVLTLQPNAVSSLNGYPDYTPRSFNYANLNRPLSASDFSLWCFSRPLSECGPIPDQYFPRLAVPEQIRDLDPAWKSCDLSFNGTFDPPRILVPASVLVEPTAAPEKPSTIPPAFPAASAVPKGAKNTDGARIPSVSSKPRPDDNPPKDPPTKDPIVKDPPIKDSTAKNPSIKDLPAEDPPANGPSVKDPPAKDPPAKDPLAKDPPADPAINNLPAKDLPSENSPNSYQPAQKLRMAHSEAIITLKSQIFTIKAAQTQIINSKALHIGSSAADILEEKISIGTDGVMVENNFHTFSTIPTPADTSGPFTIAAQLFTEKNDKIVVIGSSTLSAGGGPATILGEAYSVGSDGISVGGETIPFSAFRNLEASNTATVFSYNVDLSTLMKNGKTLRPAGILILTKTLDSFPALPTITIGSKPYTANAASQYVIDGKTLTPASSITLSGIVFSLDASASRLIIQGATTQKLTPVSTLPTLTINSQSYTANPAGQYIINGQSLTPGGAIIVSGTTISLASAASALVVGGTTQPLSPLPPLPTLTIKSHTYTANLAGEYIISGQTLTPGGAITVSGTQISLAPSASAVVVVGGTTETLASTWGLGKLVLHGFYNGPSPSASSTKSVPGYRYTGARFESVGKSGKSEWSVVRWFVWDWGLFWGV